MVAWLSCATPKGSVVLRPCSVKVITPGLVEVIGLGDEQIDPGGRLEQPFRPGAVAGIGHRLAVADDPERARWPVAGMMVGAVRNDRDWSRTPLLLDLVLLDPELEAPRLGGRPWKQTFHGGGQALFRRSRSGDEQRLVALADVIGVQKEERQTAEMVAVQVRQQNAVDAVGIDAESIDGNHRRRAAVDQKPSVRGSDHETGIEPPAGPERVAATEKPHFHRPALSSVRSHASVFDRRLHGRSGLL